MDSNTRTNTTIIYNEHIGKKSWNWFFVCVHLTKILHYQRNFNIFNVRFQIFRQLKNSICPLISRIFFRNAKSSLKMPMIWRFFYHWLFLCLRMRMTKLMPCSYLHICLLLGNSLLRVKYLHWTSYSFTVSRSPF